MRISELIELLTACLKEGDRPVLLEIEEAVGVNIVGQANGGVRDGMEALVLTADEIDKPEWIP